MTAPAAFRNETEKDRSAEDVKVSKKTPKGGTESVDPQTNGRDGLRWREKCEMARTRICKTNNRRQTLNLSNALIS